MTDFPCHSWENKYLEGQRDRFIATKATKGALYAELEAGNERIRLRIAESWGDRKGMSDFPCHNWEMWERCKEDCYLETVCEFAAVYREFLSIQAKEPYVCEEA